MIKKNPKGGFDLYNKAGTKKIGHHKTKEGAIKQEQAIQIAKSKVASYYLKQNDKK